MLLLPIGRDQAIVRRQPVISYSIIALNVLVFVLFNLLSPGLDEKALEKKWEEITSLLESRPYLVVPPEIDRLLDPGSRQYLAESRRSMRTGGELPSPWIQQKHQNRLEHLTGELQTLISASPIMRNAYVPAKGGIISIITALFFHAGLVHLLGNMLFFFVTGPFMEDVYGRPLFTLLYFSGGAIATWTHAWQHPGSLAPLVGASGAIAAIMGAYLIRFFSSRIQFIFIPIIFLPRFSLRFSLPAFVVLPLWAGEQLILATQAGSVSTVAWWAHVGGFGYGLLIALLFMLTGLERRWIDPDISQKISWNQDERLVRAGKLQAEGRLLEASRIVADLLRSQPRNVDARRFAYELAREFEDWKAVAEHSARLLEHYIEADEKELAIELIRDMIPSRSGVFPERFHTRAAHYLEEIHETDWAMEVYREIEARAPESAISLRAIVRMAELTRRRGDSAAAEKILERAVGHPEYRGELKDRIDREIASAKGK